MSKLRLTTHTHLQEIYRDAKILEIFEGANEVLQWVIARH